MAVRLHKGKTKLMYFPVTVSTVMLKDALAAWASGQLIAAVNDAEGYIIAGVTVKAIATTDTDYAVERLIAVRVPTELYTEWQVTVDATAALVVTDIGTFMDIGSDDTGDDIESGTSTYDHWLCTGFISTTEGYFTPNWGILGRRKAAS